MPERVLKLLRDFNSGGEVQGGIPCPGPKISAALGITRSAVWKKIRRLEAAGYRIAASKSGYRLLDGPDLSAFELRYRLPGVRIFFKENVSSTNDLAMETALGDSRPALVIANSQTAGRGRLGRQWLSPPDANIYMSVVFQPEIPPRRSPLLALAAGLASALAIKGQTGLPVRLKWPNDLIAPVKADGRCKKIGGILLEFRSDPDRLLFAVAGIGINANLERADLPKGMGAAATSILAETGRRVDRAALAAAVYKELDYWTGLLKKGAKAEVQLLNGYRSLCITIGRKIRVQTEGQSFAGTATGIDDDGRLILSTETGAKRLRFSTGEVSSVRSGDN